MSFLGSECVLLLSGVYSLSASLCQIIRAEAESLVRPAVACPAAKGAL